MSIEQAQVSHSLPIWAQGDPESQSDMARVAFLLLSTASADILLASFDGKASHQWKQMNDPAPWISAVCFLG